jgi:hypothetical protein
MPESGPNFFSPVVSSNPQPQLLEQRKAWMKQDRDVKLAIFLSVADDLKVEVFEVGPPLPPPSMTAKEMIEALDEHFQGKLDFEEYHHAFCHFLNLHIDQFSSVEEFNTEFSATLEDLLDHGMPLDNVQACSAYFSKLRCTQNPWVAKKLKEWDTLSSPPQLNDLMKEYPPWMIIKPLKPTAQTSAPESYNEDLMADIKEVDDERSSDSDKSGRTTPSTTSSHSRSSSMHSQEITVKASVEDLTEAIEPPKPTKKLSAIPKRLSPKVSLPKMTSTPPPLNRPLPPLPAEITRSTSPIPKPVKWETTTSNPPNPEIQPTVPRSQTPQLLLPEDVHPALRGTSGPPTSNPANAPKPTSTPEKAQTIRPQTPPPATLPVKRPSSSHSPPTLAPPLFQSAQLSIRPASSRGPSGPSTYKSILDPKVSMDSISTWPPPRSKSPLMRIDSSGSSTLSLPLQGANEPEFRDTVMSGTGKHANHTRAATLDFVPRPMENSDTLGELRSVGPFGTSPPRSLMSRLSAELNDEVRKNRKKSWSLKGKLPKRRLEVQEMI